MTVFQKRSAPAFLFLSPVPEFCHFIRGTFSKIITEFRILEADPVSGNSVPGFFKNIEPYLSAVL